MMKVKGQPEVAVLPIHFEDRSGTEFERLCFAYLLRAFDWKTIDWYGQLGGDSATSGPSGRPARPSASSAPTTTR
jgi:hypothetical protein